jgi:8-oxo-dGTP diphosphatase
MDMKHLSKAIVVQDGKVLVQETVKSSSGAKVIDFPLGLVSDNESATDAARKLIVEADENQVQHTATFSGVNEKGGRTYYAIFKADAKAKLKLAHSDMPESARWVEPKDLPLKEFHAEDIDFIKTHLPQYS